MLDQPVISADIDPDAQNLPATGSKLRNLLAACLRQACRDYVYDYKPRGGSSVTRQSAHHRTNKASQAEQHENSAEFWLFEEKLSARPFSLGWICSHLDLDVEQLREAIREEKRESFN